MEFKKLLKPRVIIWAASTVLLTALLVTATVLTTKTFKPLVENFLGRDTAITKKGDTGIAFDQEFTDKAEARENGEKVVKEICEEGMVLLKNDNSCLPLKTNAKVSVFGKNSVNLVYGGSGSAAPGADTVKKTIFDSLTGAGIKYNDTLKKFYENNSKSGKGRDNNPDFDVAVTTLSTGETPISSYSNDIIGSYDEYGDAAIVVFSRIAGETFDLPRVASDSNDRHYLELDNNERALLRHIADSHKFEHIIILMNGSNYIDLGFLKAETNPTDYNDFGKYIDGAIVIGSPGGVGIMALGEILSGKVNPSGHTVDTIYANYRNDPTWQNFGEGIPYGDGLPGQVPYGGAYRRTNGSYADYYGVDYEENIYLGYRYYETRGHEKGDAWYNANVVYPFGYGLSYTTFTQEIVNKSALEAAALNATEPFEVQVKVKNTGDRAGKQVIQLYAEAPYTAGGIEKSYKVLVGFAKTDLLAKNGGEETVKITVDPYDFASFDSRDLNHNDKKAYELDGGDYVFHVATDAHNDVDTFTKNLASTYVFENNAADGSTVDELFPEMTSHMDRGQNLSRADMAQDNPASFPVAQTLEELTITDEEYAKYASFDPNSSDTKEYTMPKTGERCTLALRDLAGKAYDDPLWEQFLDQLTPADMLKLFNEGCYSTTSITKDLITKEVDPETGEEVEKVLKNYVIIPATTSADGPTGFVNFMGKSAVYGCCYYQSECLLAQTYNLKLAKDQAHALGNESLVGDQKGDGLPYPGWYGPAVNLHRSPFSGRNTEYYSEDPFISGKFAVEVVKGVQEKGVYVNIKHFALNDQESYRDANGIATWVDEQGMRELYLKPFEMAVKQANARGVMSSFNRLGYEWAGGCYRLLTTVLREEWGFKGTVICDFKTKDYMDSKQMLYAGGDIGLLNGDMTFLKTGSGPNNIQFTDAKAVSYLRRAAKNTLYALANSNIMKAEVLGYKLATWKVILFAADGAIGAGLLVWGFFVIFTVLGLWPKQRKQAAEAANAEPANAEPAEKQE